MKNTIIYATSAFFLLGTSFAHEVAVTPVVVAHKSIVEHRIVQLNPKIGAMCTTSYVTVTETSGKTTTRKSVDCDE